MNLPRFWYHSPEGIDEASRILKEYGPSAAVLGGGTELLVRMKYRLATPECIVSLKNIGVLKQIALVGEEGRIRIGAGARLADLAASPIIVQHLPALAYAASLVASEQIRHMATIGGNLLQNTRCFYYNRSAAWQKTVRPCIKRGGDVCHVVPGSRRCFAVYQGDLAPVLIALGTAATVRSADGERRLPIEGLFTGDGSAPFVLEAQEFLTECTIPIPSGGTGAAYRKYRIRKGVDFPLAGVAGALAGESDTAAALRVCLTGIWSSPVIVKEAGKLAAAGGITGETVKAIAEAAFRAAHPQANVEGTPARRRAMIRLMTEQVLQEITPPF
jgi:4-hydroxybenzoyl-CoA reductase subunit beta